MPRINKLDVRMLASDEKGIEMSAMYTKCDFRANALQCLGEKISTG